MPMHSHQTVIFASAMLDLVLRTAGRLTRPEVLEHLHAHREPNKLLAALEALLGILLAVPFPGSHPENPAWIEAVGFKNPTRLTALG